MMGMTASAAALVATAPTPMAPMVGREPTVHVRPMEAPEAALGVVTTQVAGVEIVQTPTSAAVGVAVAVVTNAAVAAMMSGAPAERVLPVIKAATVKPVPV